MSTSPAGDPSTIVGEGAGISDGGRDLTSRDPCARGGVLAQIEADVKSGIFIRNMWYAERVFDSGVE